MKKTSKVEQGKMLFFLHSREEERLTDRKRVWWASQKLNNLFLLCKKQFNYPKRGLTDADPGRPKRGPIVDRDCFFFWVRELQV